MSMNKMRDLARDLNAKRMAERELLVARFILENPKIPAARIGIVEQFSPNGSVFMVRQLTNAEIEQRDKAMLQ